MSERNKRQTLLDGLFGILVAVSLFIVLAPTFVLILHFLYISIGLLGLFSDYVVWAPVLLGTLMAAVIAGVLARTIVRASTRKRDASNPVCPECGYSLRGLQAARCPECGSVFL